MNLEDKTLLGLQQWTVKIHHIALSEA